MRFDHVIYAADDLATGTDRVTAALGIYATDGGVHEGQGTCNTILPFAGGYVEVLALVDPGAPPASPLAHFLKSRLDEHGEGLFGWAMAVDDIEAEAERHDLQIMPLSRPGFSARLAGLGEAMADPALPFFIQRDAGVPAPFEEGDAIDSLLIQGEEDALRSWLGEVPPYVGIRWSTGAPGVRAITIEGRMLGLEGA